MEKTKSECMVITSVTLVTKGKFQNHCPVRTSTQKKKNGDLCDLGDLSSLEPIELFKRNMDLSKLVQTYAPLPVPRKTR
jgi:hypothetical protein